MVSFKVLASTTLQILISNMRVRSASAKWKAKASKHGWMGDDTKVTLKTEKKDGEGTFYWPSGQTYIGSWRLGKQHGLGIMLDPDTSEKKHGEWVTGKRQRWIGMHEAIN